MRGAFLASALRLVKPETIGGSWRRLIGRFQQLDLMSPNQLILHLLL